MNNAHKWDSCAVAFACMLMGFAAPRAQPEQKATADLQGPPAVRKEVPASEAPGPSSADKSTAFLTVDWT